MIPAWSRPALPLLVKRTEFVAIGKARIGLNCLLLRKLVCHEKDIRKVGHLKEVLRNFERDGGRPTAYGVQAQFANHFVRL